MIKIWVDGLSRGNHKSGKGIGAVGIVIESESNTYHFGYRMDQPVTNNEAEYAALLIASRKVSEFGKIFAQEVFVFTDSQLVANQMNGCWKTKEKKFLPVQIEIETHLSVFNNVFYVWIPRNMNKEADKIANRAADSEKQVCSLSPYFEDKK
jgi:ribonuclease HI